MLYGFAKALLCLVQLALNDCSGLEVGVSSSVSVVEGGADVLVEDFHIGDSFLLELLEGGKAPAGHFLMYGGVVNVLVCWCG